MFRKNLNIEIINFKTCDMGRTLLVNAKIGEEVLTLVNIYAPNSEKDRIDFYTKVENWINEDSLNTDNIILGGDFNCCH